MSNRFTVAGILGCLFLPLAVAGQQPPPRSVRLVSTRPEAERATFEKATFELLNIGRARTDQQLQQILTAQPENGVVRALWATTCLNITGAERTRELDRAVQDAARASAPELVLVTAIREYRAGRVADALTLLDAAAHLLPGDPLVEWFRIYWTAAPADRLRVAEAAHEKFPNDPGLLNSLAYERYRSGFKKEGLAMAEQYARAVPDHPNSHDTWAELLHLDGDLTGAAQHYQRTLELDPGWLGGHQGLANVAISSADFRTALTHIEAAIPRSREPIERGAVLFQAGWTAALAGDANGMRQYVNQAIAQAEANKMPNTARDRRIWLATLEAALGNRRQAQALLEDPASNTPAYAHIGVARTMAYALLDDQQQVNAGVAEQEKATAAGGNIGILAESLHLARLVRAAGAGDIAGARAELPALTSPNYLAYGNAYLYRALKKAKDNKGAAEAKDAARKYLTFDPVRGFTVLLTK